MIDTATDKVTATLKIAEKAPRDRRRARRISSLSVRPDRQRVGRRGSWQVGDDRHHRTRKLARSDLPLARRQMAVCRHRGGRSSVRRRHCEARHRSQDQGERQESGARRVEPRRQVALRERGGSGQRRYRRRCEARSSNRSRSAIGRAASAFCPTAAAPTSPPRSRHGECVRYREARHRRAHQGGEPLQWGARPPRRQAGIRHFGRKRHVQVIDPATNTIVREIAVGRRPWNMGLTPDGKKLYVACGRPTGCRVDTGTYAKIAEIPVGDLPWGVAIW